MRSPFLLVCSILALSTAASAEVLCKKKNGSVVVRAEACKRKETVLDLAQFGAVGPRGEKGDKGDTGDPGAPGSQGEQGEPGPLLTTLPSGATQRGFFGGGAAVGSGDYVEAPLSYPVPLASSPTPHIVPVGGPAPTACPGSVSSPAAAAGHLCLYFGWIDGTCGDTQGTFGSDGNDDREHGVVVTTGPTTAGQCDFSGTWAVTAP